jgi:DNA-binding NarL/FixJ family response regulator
MTRALLIEPQALFAPYFAGVIAGAGSDVTVSERAPKRLLRSLKPSLVVFDATGTDAAPLRMISGVRASLPNTRIVIFARIAEPLWAGVAKALGADAVIGPKASESDLLAALRA